MTGHNVHTANAFASTFYFFADTQINAKKIKRACKPTHGGHCKLDTTDLRPKRTTTHNRRLAKKRVQCLNEALRFASSSVLADSLVLRNPLLRQAPKRCK